VLVLDGGLATELEARGHDLNDALWSARLLADRPDEITAAHEAFFRAGAMVATTASYQASFSGFAAHGIGHEEAAELMRRSVVLARRAAAGAPQRYVAASVGPYGAVLADGSEYRGRYGLTARQLRDFHRPRMEVLAEAEPDFFALETIPDVDEAAAEVELAAEFGIPAWLSYTIRGERTCAGQPLEEAFAVAAGQESVIAVGVNCSSPADATRAVSVAREVSGKPVVLYPNSGEGWDPVRQEWTGPAGFSADLVPRWCADGARLIGGCCRVSPADIGRVAAAARAVSS
jgi:homocysteine S-methyltransferase